MSLNVVNRLLVITLLLVLLFAGLVLAILTAFFPRESIAALYSTVETLQRNLSFLWQAVVFALGLGLAMLALLGLRREVTPQRRNVRLSQVTSGSAALSTDSIAQRLRFDLEQQQGVREVRPLVRSRGKMVDIDLGIRYGPDVDVSTRTDEILKTAREVVESRMGVKIGHLRAQVEHGGQSYNPAARGEMPPSLGLGWLRHRGTPKEEPKGDKSE